MGVQVGLMVLVALAALLVGIGLVFLAGGVVEARRQAVLRRYGTAVRGTLLSLRRSGGFSARAVVRFRAGDDQLVTVSSVASRSTRRLAASKKIRPGGPLSVRYDPDDPRNAIVDGFDTRTQPWVYLVCGIAAVVAGMLLAGISLPGLGWDLLKLG